MRQASHNPSRRSSHTSRLSGPFHPHLSCPAASALECLMHRSHNSSRPPRSSSSSSSCGCGCGMLDFSASTPLHFSPCTPCTSLHFSQCTSRTSQHFSPCTSRHALLCASRHALLCTTRHALLAMHSSALLAMHASHAMHFSPCRHAIHFSHLATQVSALLAMHFLPYTIHCARPNKDPPPIKAAAAATCKAFHYTHSSKDPHS